MSTNTSCIINRCRLFLAFALTVAAQMAVATPQVAIEFVQEQGSSHEWIHAQANCLIPEPQVHDMLSAVVKYPGLHNWIEETTIESNPINGEQQFLVEFKFPWPVGKQWSRVVVRKDDDSSISWRQLEGSLKMNQGRIAISEHDQETHLDYRAMIDVGYPNAFTRRYKKQFVLEFLNAIYDAIVKMDSA